MTGDHRGDVAAVKSSFRPTVVLRWGRDVDTFDRDAMGRPVTGRRDVHVSVSHAGELTVVALSNRPVGVDLETRRPTAPIDLDDWVRREAVLKALGVGLSVDPWSFDLGTDRVTAWRAEGRRPALRIAAVHLIDGHALAVARVGRRRFGVSASPAASPRTATA